jgi:transcriptional regulator with XRE-family HTH domain
MEDLEMKDRIAHIIRAKNLTAAEFALKLGIQPSSISHLLSGRNNPSLDFVKKLKETFPEYNLDWIVLGKGPMTVSVPFEIPAPAANEPALQNQDRNDSGYSEGTLFDYPVEAESRQKQAVPSSDLSLQRIIFVYSDHTFEVIAPR